MAVYRFSLVSGEGPPDLSEGVNGLPPVLQVMYAGECIADAILDNDGYECDLPEEYLAKIALGKLEPIFVVEPPIGDGLENRVTEHEFVSILLVGIPRRRITH